MNAKSVFAILGILVLITMCNHFFRAKFEMKRKWQHFPSTRPKYGIIMAGTSDKFSWMGTRDSYVTTCIAKLYAQKHGYGFALIEDLENLDHRHYGECNSFPQWNKIIAMENYIRDVDILLWIDLDAVIVQFNKPLGVILPDYMPGSSCNNIYHDIRELGSDFQHRNISDLPGAVDQAFFWASMDINPMYSLNLNTGVMALRSGPQAERFLDLVWRKGEDINAFKRHDENWRHKQKCQGYYGWPWEQGAVWDVLADRAQVDLLRATCILPHIGPAALNSIIDYWKDVVVHAGRPFIIHKPERSMREVLQAFIANFDVDLTLIQSECHYSVANKLKSN